ncbi:MAG: FAD-dependent thymidylate synthase [Candidatus Palauibacterales bacterium]|nr:FAD-dependent thymidylate synthase [Candidatus Palauibacterales bacterium]MDP2528492.1 FAD-dependent thymidylate synthase [Candidatus Palauibacterales bacterium]MDP2584039.1 FAD-dependent thymidylate synthase [Candidatus Palauibacterales bacterium]
METRRPTSPAAEEILGGYFPVLDHGFVALVDYMGGDEDIERAARVSYGYGTRKRSATRGLIRYLRRHRHTTPSEMVELKFHCCMPIFVARQWVRHRTANINEYSGRYSLIPLLFYTPEHGDFALQSRSNRQGRRSESAGEVLHREAVRRWERGREEVAGLYEWLVGEQVARELARIDLPLSTYTQWYWKIDLHNLLHFLSLRVDPHAQKEIRAYGEIMAGMLKRVAPLSYEAWLDYQVAGTVLSRGELEALRRLLEPAGDAEGIRVRAEGDGAGGTDGAAGRSGLTGDQLRELGLSGREVLELLEKLRPADRPDFDLDLSAMKTAEHFAELMERAVPGADVEG